MAPQPVPPEPAKPASETKSSLAAGLKGLQAGETTIDDTLAFEVELASYAELGALTKVLKARLDNYLRVPAAAKDGAASEPCHLFFVDNALRLALDTSAALEAQLNNLEEAYRAVTLAAMAALAPPPGFADRLDSQRAGEEFVALPGFVPAAQAAIALLGALRTDTRYAGRQVTIPEHAFALALGHEWEASRTVHFHYPSLFVPPTAGRAPLMQRFVTQMDAAVKARSAASEAVTKLLLHVSRMNAASPEFAAAKATLDSIRDQFSAAEAVFESVSSKLSKVDDKTGLNQLQLLERAGFVASIAAQAKDRTFYLFAQVVSAGGAFRISKNLLRTLFWGDALEHAGGCLITYGLFNADGRLLASDTIGSRSTYMDSRPAITVR